MSVHAQNSRQGSNTTLPGTPNLSTLKTGATTSLPFHFDPADNVNRPVPGWPALANLISNAHHLEAFPSFADLAIKSLLYYQAELISLRKDLHKAEWADYRNIDNEDHAENLGFLISARDNAIKNNTQLPEQWVLMEKIRTTLEKYNTALLQYSRVSAFMKADNANVETLRYCAQRVARHNATLAGPGSATWGDLNVVTAAQKPLWELFWGLFTGMFCSRNLEYRQIDNVFQEHLIVPREGKEPDRLTIWVSQSFIPFYDHLRRHYILPVYSRLRSSWHNMLPGKQKRSDTIENPEGGKISRSANNSEIGPTQSLTIYSGSGILRLTFITLTLAACLLPTVAIIVLAMFDSKNMVLGLIAAFTGIFSLGLLLFGSSSNTGDQIFLATVAFSAVMVVFVQDQVSPR